MESTFSWKRDYYSGFIKFLILSKKVSAVSSILSIQHSVSMRAESSSSLNVNSCSQSENFIFQPYLIGSPSFGLFHHILEIPIDSIYINYCLEYKI